MFENRRRLFLALQFTHLSEIQFIYEIQFIQLNPLHFVRLIQNCRSAQQLITTDYLKMTFKTTIQYIWLTVVDHDT